MQFELIWRFFQLLGVRTRIGYFTQIQLLQFQDRQNVTHNQTTQLHKLLIFRDSHGYPNDLLEKVIIFHHFPGAPTDLLEEIIIFLHSQGAPTDLLGKIIIFRHSGVAQTDPFVDFSCPR